jgi:hypothetical protein
VTTLQPVHAGDTGIKRQITLNGAASLDAFTDFVTLIWTGTAVPDELDTTVTDEDAGEIEVDFGTWLTSAVAGQYKVRYVGTKAAGGDETWPERAPGYDTIIVYADETAAAP